MPQENIIPGCVAALRDVKNHKGLINAFSQVLQVIGNTTLVIVGSGPLAEALQQQAHALKIAGQVIFTGQKDNIGQYLKAFDLFVLNSKTEGLSYAVLEAMSSGLPVVATHVGGNAQIINHDTDGLLYEEGNETALSDTLVQILKNPEKIRFMGKQAREKILQDYSLEAMVKQYDRLYQGLV
mgnify:CR=1 FL=1